MRIGVDFDNTIVTYDSLFHRLAVERGLIPSTVGASKQQVRDHLRAAAREDDWTELQGYVYGARLCDAPPFPGVLDFFRRCRHQRLDVCIISHKTRHPFRGPALDLHDAARNWLARHGFFDDADIALSPDHVYLETTLADKLARIGALNCTHFVDDLPELLREPLFPAGTRRVLFDPNARHGSTALFTRVGSWAEASDLLLGPAARVA